MIHTPQSLSWEDTSEVWKLWICHRNGSERCRQREGNGQTHRDQQEKKPEEPETDFYTIPSLTSPRRG